jgi:hypothetical protein
MRRGQMEKRLTIEGDNQISDAALGNEPLLASISTGESRS